MNTDEFYMQRCLQLAKNGIGTAFPNPLVGCVIVHNDKIIGEGFHYQPGGAHAEVHAINSVKDQNLLRQSSLYVNLEPCSHFGKTPPCADLIIEKGIPEIIIGTVDPSKKVKGKGIQKLFTNGHQVNVGILEDDCERLNKRFFCFHLKKRPYIILKWAESKDGFIAPKNQGESRPFWISNAYSKQLSHQLRSREMGILIGTKTALKDNPSLTTRDWAGPSPIRIVIDKNLKIPARSELLNQKEPTIIFCEKPRENSKNIYYEAIDFSKQVLQQILTVLREYTIQSLIVEGGSHTAQQFIDADLWDEAQVFTSENKLIEGLSAPKLPYAISKERNIGNNQLSLYFND